MVLLMGCSTTKNGSVFKLRITYLNGKRDTKIVEFYHQSDDINMRLKKNCIVYSDDRELLCNVKKFTQRQIDKPAVE